MRTLNDMTEIVGTRQRNDETFEICASGQAQYEDDDSKLTVVLDSFVRRVNLRGRDEYLKPAWLPHRDVASDHLPLEEAHGEAREIFARWARKVREVIPDGTEFAASLRNLPPHADLMNKSGQPVSGAAH